MAGLSTTPVASSFYQWLPRAWLVAHCAIVIPMLNYVIANLSDLVDTTDVYYVLAGVFQIATKFYVLWSHMPEVIRLIDELQDIVNRRECRLQ